MTESTEIVVSGAALSSELNNMNKGQLGMFSTIEAVDFESKVALMTALSNSEPIAENLKKTILLANVVVESTDMADEKTGEIKAQPRILLIDSKGNAFHAISTPLYRDVKRFLSIMKHPSTWAAPAPVYVVQEGQGTRKYFTLMMGEAPTK